MFGFIRVEKSCHKPNLLSRINDLQVEGAKIEVNIAIYGKSGPVRNHRTMGPEPEKRNGSGNGVPQYAMTSYGVSSRTYKEALEGDLRVATVNLDSKETWASKVWKNTSIIGEAKSLSILENLMVLMESLGIQHASFCYVGGLHVLIHFPITFPSRGLSELA